MLSQMILNLGMIIIIIFSKWMANKFIIFSFVLVNILEELIRVRSFSIVLVRTFFFSYLNSNFSVIFCEELFTSIISLGLVQMVHRQRDLISSAYWVSNSYGFLFLTRIYVDYLLNLSQILIWLAYRELVVTVVEPCRT